MKKIIQALCLALLCNAAPGATVTVGSWRPIFKGIELASGRQQAQFAGEVNQQALCLRVDLTDPDIELFPTPRCTNCSGYDTVSENTSHFVEQYGVQAAVNGSFYRAMTGGSDPSSLGIPVNVYGLAISQGNVVSVADNPSYADVMLFNSNNVPFFVPNDWPPTNTAGIYTAISGQHALLLQGVNLQSANPSDLDPRTAVGVSMDKYQRYMYLYLMTIDGRQSGWSDGADFRDTGEWLKRFGATDGIAVDGGGSTTMVVADCVGKAVRLNRPSLVAAIGRERYIGHNIGVYAKPLPSGLKNLKVEPAATTCLLTWDTDLPATTQVQYGTTTNYGSATPLDARLTRKHVATLAGLMPGSTYFYRAISTAGGQSYTEACQFIPLAPVVSTQVFGLTNIWTYTTNNLDGVNWKAPGYNEPNWLGQGPGLLCVEDAPYVGPKGTALPAPSVLPIPTTYYFRTHFPFTGSTAGATMTLSNYVDDGAVFYLNGAELYRLRMAAAPTAITNRSLAIAYACVGFPQSGDAAANCPDVFTVSGGPVANLVQSDNVLAVEVHNYATGSPDIVFGSALTVSTPALVLPTLFLWIEDNVGTFFWNGEGFTLQEASALAGSGNWSDVPGPVTRSPFILTNPTAPFYRLRR